MRMTESVHSAAVYDSELSPGVLNDSKLTLSGFSGTKKVKKSGKISMYFINWFVL